MNDDTFPISRLKEKATQFIHDRDWRQFHGAKNLSMNIAVEASELMEIFTWARDQQEANQLVEEKKQEVTHELADIFWGVLLFADEFNIDLSDALIDKLELTGKKYPIEKAKGKNKKYSDL